jgi:GMP synthase (glutamine-hydrolysing)
MLNDEHATKPSPRRVVRVIQHETGEGPGLIEEALALEGVACDVVRVDLGQPVPAALGDAVGLVVLGGGMGVNEAGQRPHLVEERDLVKAALGAGVPVLGTCLGSQILAWALGASVRAAPAKEIGWFEVTPGPAAATDPLFAPLPERFTTFHWHGDVFELPSGAVSLASSERTAHQAFRHGDRAYGLLFHLEVTPVHVRSMVSACGAELREAGVPGATLVDGAERWAGPAEAIAVPLFRRWAALLSA